MASTRNSPPRPYVPGGARGIVTITAGGRVNARRLKDLIAHAPDRGDRVAQVHAGLVAYWAREFAPEQEPNSKGFMQKKNDLSIKEGIIVQKIGGGRYAVLATAPHSAPQEFGSEPHDITGTDMNLRFWWENMNRWHSAFKVRHPGNPPHPFMLPARRRVAASFSRELRRIFTDAGL